VAGGQLVARAGGARAALPGRQRHEHRLGQRLRALGIRPNPARSAALFGLAAELPAAILARMLGVAIGVGVDWQHLASGDWTSYAAEVSRRTKPDPRRRAAEEV
jgi:hypothetical protein